MKVKPIKLINVLVILSLMLGFVQTIPVMAKEITPQAGTTIGFSPATAAATTCEAIEVNVVVNDVEALTGYHLEMTFDQTKLQVVDVENGGLLYDGEDRVGLYEPVLDKGNTTGRLIWGMAQRGVGGDPSPVTGSGSLLKITLKALATSGSDTLEIDADKTMLVDWPDAFEIDYDVVGSAPISLASCAPTAIALDNSTVAENLAVPALVGNLSATDPDGDSLTYTLVDNTGHPDNAAFSIDGNKLNTAAVFNYEVKDTYTIKIRVTDEHGEYIEKVFTITVIDVNDAPVLATIPNATIPEMVAYGFEATATDDDGDELTFSLVDGPDGATIDATSGEFGWTPSEAQGPNVYTFTVKVCDNGDPALCDEQDVTLTVAEVNVAPVAVDDTTYTTAFETLLTVEAPGVLINDTDVEGDALTAVLGANVNNGTLVLSADGSFTYKPNDGFNGVDIFTYMANDGELNSMLATVKITVLPFTNTPPVAVDDNYWTDQNVDLTVSAVDGILANDTDIDGDNLKVSLLTGVSNGNLELLENGSFTYKPTAGYCGTDSFTYTLVSFPKITGDGLAVDGAANITADDGWTAEATVTITVYCDAKISSSDLDGPFYVGNLQEFQVRLENPAPGHEYDSLAASIFVDGITAADFSIVQVKHPNPLIGWVTLTPIVVGDGMRIDLGPITSLPLTSGFDLTLTFRVNFNTPGEYEVTSTLYDGEDSTKVIATYSDTMVVAALLAQDFGYMYQSDVLGVTAGFANVNFDLSEAVEIKVELFTGPDTAYVLLQTNTAVDPDLMASWTQFSGPFDIFGTFDYAADGYWTNVRAGEYGKIAIPSRVLATITLPDGITLTAENTILTGERGYILDTLDEEIVSAPSYDYDPEYIPVGTSTFDSTNNTYTGTYTAPQVLAGGPMDDLARYLGALYRQDDSTITSIEFDGKTYTWHIPAGAKDLAGSNWRDAAGTTLVSVVTAKFQAEVQAETWATDPGYTMTVHDDYDHSANVTFKMIILNTLDDELESAPGYVYTPVYPYVGSRAFDDSANIYTLTYNDTNFAPGAMNDLARYLGALHYQAGATVFTIEYKGTIYYWNPAEPNTGSNWYAGSTSLVSVITAEAVAGQIDPAVGFTLKLSDAFHTENVTFRYIINDTTAPTIGSGTAIGATGFGDVPADANLAFVVNQGYTVDHIEFVMSEAVTVLDGTVVSLGGKIYGTVSVDSTGLIVTVTPAPNNKVASIIGGPFIFTIPDGSIKDMAGNSLTTLSATLTVLNVAPVAVDDDAYSVDEDETLTVDAPGVLANDTDYPGTTLTAELVSGPSNGTLTLNPGGSFVYTPTPNFNGTDKFTYQAKDGELAGNTATVTITVNPVNDAPVAEDQSVTTPEDTAIEIIMEATDIDLDTLIYSIVEGLTEGPDHGTLGVVSGNKVTYTPNANYYGTDKFTFRASDGTYSDTATVTITVTSVNDAPVLTTISNATISEMAHFGFEATATDVENNALIFSLVTAPEGASITEAGVFSWTPSEAQGPGTHKFTVKVCEVDTPTLCDEQEVTLTVTEVNRDPVLAAIGNKSVVATEKLEFEVTASDPDLPENTLTYSLVDAPDDAEIDATSGEFSWTPTEAQVGDHVIKVCVNDGTVTVCETITITVTSRNSAPVAVADTYEVDMDGELVVEAPGVLINDTDTDGDVLTAILISGPDLASGTLDFEEDGSFTFTPALGFSGEVSFTYKAFDGKEYSNTVTVTITVLKPVQTDYPIYLPLIFK